jgi:hypothetical protein
MVFVLSEFYGIKIPIDDNSVLVAIGFALVGLLRTSYAVALRLFLWDVNIWLASPAD